MTIHAIIKKGKIIPTQPLPFPDGTEVTITPHSNGHRSVAAKKRKNGRKSETLSEMLLRHAGTIKGMPRDWSRNHDHYLYGVPKKKR